MLNYDQDLCALSITLLCLDKGDNYDNLIIKLLMVNSTLNRQLWTFYLLIWYQYKIRQNYANKHLLI